MRRARRTLVLPFLIASSLAFGHPPQEQERSVVAVLRFDNNTGDGRYDHLGRAMSSMMISDLSVIERIQLVERERLEEVMAELDLQYSGRVDPETAQSLGMIVGAEYMVFGSFVTVDPEMRLDTRVTRTETTEIVTTADVRGQGESLFDLQQQLADTLIAGLELVLTEEERARLRAQQEANRIDDMETVIAFSEALCLLDYGAYPEAFEAIQQVQTAAPGSPLVRATFELLRERAAEDAQSRVTDAARSRIGGLGGLGRVVERNLPEPERRRPAQC
ncbi:MAG TPA: CsgG/HfaB family protein [Longimicrobiales bacterium]|nr:CsgG/HfaB family protein [Longimicrobiales bacterium]